MNVRNVTLTTTSGRLISRRMMTCNIAHLGGGKKAGRVGTVDASRATDSVWPRLDSARLLCGATGQGAPSGIMVIHAGDVDALDAVADEHVDLGVEERQPADFGRPRSAPPGCRDRPAWRSRPTVVSASLRQLIELGVRPVAVVVADLGLQLQREEVLRVGVVGAPDAVVGLQTRSPGRGRCRSGAAERRQLERLERDRDAQVLLPHRLQHGHDPLVVPFDAVGQREGEARRVDPRLGEESLAAAGSKSSPVIGRSEAGNPAGRMRSVGLTVPPSTAFARVSRSMAWASACRTLTSLNGG